MNCSERFKAVSVYWSCGDCFCDTIQLHMADFILLFHPLCVSAILRDLNTLRTGDADLRFYITSVQDG